MKSVILALVTVMAPLFAHAETETATTAAAVTTATTAGESTMKLSEVNEEISVRATVARKEIQAIDSDLRKANDEINKIETIEISAEALTNVGFPSRFPDAFATLKTGFEIERAQLLQDRKAMLEEATVASK